MQAMRLIWALSGLALVAPANASDKLCGELEKFVKNQEVEQADPMPRHWVEFHWGIDPDPNSFWSWGCRHAADNSSKQFCTHLLDNTSREFRNTLPLRIQQCMGYRFPEQAWSGWHVSDGVIKHQRKNGSWLVMEIVSQGLQAGESAVRISYDTVDRKLEPVEPEPVKPLFLGEARKLQ
jgi:hypothetical protein